MPAAVDAVLAPAVLVGAAAGRAVIRRLDQARFEQLVLLLSAVASVNLLL